jgi:hypothetical protein
LGSRLRFFASTYTDVADFVEESSTVDVRWLDSEGAPDKLCCVSWRVSFDWDNL